MDHVLSEAQGLHIDGSQGEGGGQILRSSLALSAICRRPVSIEKIRANRSKPGLRPQHLTGVQAMARLCEAAIEGDAINSDALRFAAAGLPHGEHSIDIGTAGSTSLLFHALYYAMAWGPDGGTLELGGGTHNEKAPTFDYIEQVWQPMLGLCGFRAEVQLERFGFYPKGGGRIRVEIPGGQRGEAPEAFHWSERPQLEKIHIKGLFAEPRAKRSKRPAQIPERMIDAALQSLDDAGISGVEFLPDAQHVESASAGAICSVFLHYGPLRAGFTAWGRRGLPAEEVGRAAAQDALAFLQSDACLEEHASDQVLLPLALAGREASFTTTHLSGHLETNAAIIEMFLPIQITFEALAQGCLQVQLQPRP